jgi:hypothetical protein
LIVMPFLRPFDNPRFQTYGEFLSFFSQICDVSETWNIIRLEIGIPNNPSHRVSCSCTKEILHTGALECFC